MYITYESANVLKLSARILAIISKKKLETLNTKQTHTWGHGWRPVAEARAPLLHHLAAVEVRQAGLGVALQSAVPESRECEMERLGG